MNSNPSVPDLRQIMRDHRGLFLAEGIVFLLLGALAIMLPLVASGILAYFIGWMALVVGILFALGLLAVDAADWLAWFFFGRDSGPAGRSSDGSLSAVSTPNIFCIFQILQDDTLATLRPHNLNKNSPKSSGMFSDSVKKIAPFFPQHSSKSCYLRPNVDEIF